MNGETYEQDYPQILGRGIVRMFSLTFLYIFPAHLRLLLCFELNECRVPSACIIHSGSSRHHLNAHVCEAYLVICTRLVKNTGDARWLVVRA